MKNRNFNLVLLLVLVFFLTSCASTSKIETVIPEYVNNDTRIVLNNLTDPNADKKAEAIYKVQLDKNRLAIPFLINLLNDDTLVDHTVIEEIGANGKLLRYDSFYQKHKPGTSDLFTFINSRRASDGVLVKTAIFPSKISDCANKALLAITETDNNKDIGRWKKWWNKNKPQ